MKALKIIGIVVGIIVIIVAGTLTVIVMNVDDVPDNIMEQFERDSGNTTDSVEIEQFNNLFNDPEFDFDDESEDSTALANDTVEFQA
ncbi:MAG: hypothetical protein JKY54_17080 [Flavobacteriales bacterium]|nr:hypothetical protein [Flavobacteriales bacterium]